MNNDYGWNARHAMDTENYGKALGEAKGSGCEGEDNGEWGGCLMQIEENWTDLGGR